MANVRESDLILNVVFTPGTFELLQLFTRSVIERSSLGIRLVANGCEGDETKLMTAFVRRHRSRVVEVYDLGTAKMVPHGRALEVLYVERRDGSHFGFMDSDIMASGAFAHALVAKLRGAAAVTSGAPTWSAETVQRRDSLGVAGTDIFDSDGFVYGSSYFALYDRDAVDDTRARWGIGFGAYRGKQLPPAVRERLTALGRRYALYDTAKVLNILLQGDGYRLCHLDHENLIHIGGMSFYLSQLAVRQPHLRPAGPIGKRIRMATVKARFDHAKFAALTLQALVEDGSLPALPSGLSAFEEQRLHEVQDVIVRLVATYSDEARRLH